MVSASQAKDMEKKENTRKVILSIDDLHVWFEPDLPLRDAHRLSHEVKDRLMARYPQIADAVIHIEPPPDQV